MGNTTSGILLPQVNFTQTSNVTVEEYQRMLQNITAARGVSHDKLGLEACSIEDELNKVHNAQQIPRWFMLDWFSEGRSLWCSLSLNL